MIQFADDNTKQQVWDMWKTVFNDPDDYMEVYFRWKYLNENTLIYIEDGKAVSSLQLLSYQFTFCGTEIPVIYLSGVCTLPEYREKGYSRQLLIKSFDIAAGRDVPLILLVPQEEWLLSFYDKQGFAQTFDSGAEALPSLKELTQRYPGDLYAAFREFDFLFRQKDMTVQKSFDDFCAMVEEAALFGFPPKKNLMGMARVIDLQRLLSLFADRYPQTAFSVSVQDELLKENSASFTINGGEAEKNGSPAETLFHFNIRKLTQLLFGYHTSGNEELLRNVFPEKDPSMGFMLE
ncbi:MAG: GNAT family N-acetyltransferase [Proteiniphilum sp.]|nr:GNAT family N-acetyltransferase [Proteiniphilum sp.]